MGKVICDSPRRAIACVALRPSTVRADGRLSRRQSNPRERERHFVLVTTSSADFTCGPCHSPSGKNSAVYSPAGSGGMMSRSPLEFLEAQRVPVLRAPG
jgi:hypothetical protein